MRLLPLLLALAAAGCARGVEPGPRLAIQQRYDALGDAARRGDRPALETLWTADPDDAGSPLAALDRAAAAGDTLLAWEATLHRFRTVADTAVVDVAVRAVERPRAGGDRRITSAVIRAWWVPAADAWRLVRSEAVGPAQTVGGSRAGPPARGRVAPAPAAPAQGPGAASASGTSTRRIWGAAFASPYVSFTE